MDEILSQPVVIDRVRALFEAHPTLYQEEAVLNLGSPGLGSLRSPQMSKRDDIRKNGGNIKQNNIFYLIQQAKNAKTSDLKPKEEGSVSTQKVKIDLHVSKVDERPP
jgi:hypothetical protein